MRLWSIHPQYLDSKGLVACWREGLLARKVLKGKTKGYRKHPQLDRFKSSFNSIRTLDSYLFEIFKEAEKRGFNFKRKKIGNRLWKTKIPITSGQIQYEFKHLLAKIKKRDYKHYKKIKKVKLPKPNPVFFIVKGKIETWERTHKMDT